MLTRWKSPPQNTEKVNDFHYGSLKSNRTGIRLAELLPGSGNKAISINLIDSYLTVPAKTPYDALSYTWGESSRNKSIICNGKRLAVTQTLLEALQRFRRPDEKIVLWIDQICICQSRIKERNQQVQMMGDIFKAASKVIVWLGDEYDDSRAGMQLMRQILQLTQTGKTGGLQPCDLELYGLPKQGHKRWKSLAAILQRPWFWRTWIVQEVVLNPQVELVLGASMITWDELESVVALLEGPMPTTWQLNEIISTDELPFSRINRIRLRHRQRQLLATIPSDLQSILDDLNITEEPVALDTDGQDDDPELLDLLLMSRGLGATDPRDKIYALLGLGKHSILPDYSMPPESVFTDFALQMVGVVNRLVVDSGDDGLGLSAHHPDVRRVMILLACAGKQNQRLELPSWVPDWTVNLASRPLIFGIGQRYAAGGDRIGLLDWHPDFGLQLCGVLLDTIQSVGTVNLEVASDTTPTELISSWWHEAQQIAHERIARSPGSTCNTDAFDAMRRRLFLCKHGYYTGSPRSVRRGSVLDLDETFYNSKHSIAQTMTLGPTRGRVFFATTTGYLGLAPYGSQEGDIVFVVRGADVPFVLRPADDHFELIGESYVQGIMDGEALDMHQLLFQEIMIR